MDCKRLQRNAGFTLIEIMVVVVILGLLAGVGSVLVMQNLEDAKIGLAETGAATLEEGIKTWQIRSNRNVSPDEVFNIMIEEKRLDREKMTDPWDEPYVVTLDEDGNYRVHSKGKDKQDNTDDDIGANGPMNSADNPGF